MNQTKINVKNFIILAFLVLVYFVPMYGQIQRVQEINSSKPTIESSTSVYERYDNRIELLGIKIKEVPIDYYGRTHAQGKKIVFLDGIKAIYSIFKYNLFKNT